MLDYEWGNPSAIVLSGDENMQESDQTQQMLDHRHQNQSDAFSESGYNGSFMHRNVFYAAPQNFAEATSVVSNHPNAHFATTNPHQHQQQHLFHNLHSQEDQSLNNSSLYDPYAAVHVSQASLLSLERAGPTGFMLAPKAEPVVGGIDFGGSSSSRIGLNLGGRTYFSSSEDDFVNRLYRRSRAIEPGSVNAPRCQAEGCRADLSHAKHYHRRHKVCEFHSKAATVIAAGLTQRFCQQCSRFHLLSEFDNGKRSCRKRLADHNRRRRKSQQANQEQLNKSQPDNARNSSSENLARSPSDSGAHLSSVTVAISPPRISLDCFRQRSYQPTTPSSSASASSLFFSNG